MVLSIHLYGPAHKITDSPWKDRLAASSDRMMWKFVLTTDRSK